MNRSHPFYLLGVIFSLALAFMLTSITASTASAQDDKPAEAKKDAADQPESLKIVIPDEPKYIDPATLIPKELAVPVTVEFEEATLKEAVDWIGTELKIPTILDEASLTEEGILINETVTDRL
ncbi:MAG: hypothetical protein WD065_19435, partial [Planctomycetaceae bacterium]